MRAGYAFTHARTSARRILRIVVVEHGYSTVDMCDHNEGCGIWEPGVPLHSLSRSLVCFILRLAVARCREWRILAAVKPLRVLSAYKVRYTLHTIHIQLPAFFRYYISVRRERFLIRQKNVKNLMTYFFFINILSALWLFVINNINSVISRFSLEISHKRNILICFVQIISTNSSYTFKKVSIVLILQYRIILGIIAWLNKSSFGFLKSIYSMR